MLYVFCNSAIDGMPLPLPPTDAENVPLRAAPWQRKDVTPVRIAYAGPSRTCRCTKPMRTSAPAEAWCNEGQDRFKHVRVVFHTELVRHGEQQRVGLGDRLVFS